MPTLDDEFLDTLLHTAGDSFTVPSSGPAAILGRVHRDDDERAHARSGASPNGAHEADASSQPLPLSAPRAVRRTVRRTVGRTVGRTVRAHRLLAAAAAVLVLVVVAGGAALLDNGNPKTTAALKAAPVTHARSPHPPTSHYGVTHLPAPSGKAAAATPTNHSTSSTGLSGAASAGSTAAAPAVPSTGSTPSNSSNSSDAANGSTFGAEGVGEPARIEQTGSLDLTVARGALSATVQRLSALATANGGFVSNSQTDSATAGGAPSGTVTMEIPVANFSATLHQVQALGKASQLTTQATDVTAQYVDLESRITALEASRQQYLTIMTKASSIGDVLAVQAQLDSLQSQIEQLQGQLSVLGSETDYSKVTTALKEPGKPAKGHHHPTAVGHSGLAKAWDASVHGFVAGAEGLIRIAGPALFALLCLAAVLLGGQVFWRRVQRRNL